MQGVEMLGEKQFPKLEDQDGDENWILVRSLDESVFQRTSPYSVTLTSGSILVSVRKPSECAIVKTPLGEVSIAANGDAIITFENGVLRILNLDGLGKSIKCKLDQGPFEGKGKHVLKIAVGFELIAGDHKLSRSELRPADGLARRHFSLVNSGFLAVTEFQLESALRAHTLIADLLNNGDSPKIRRVVGDLSKMASVLNYVRGTEGYIANAKLAGI